jgi:hypothetical protein
LASTCGVGESIQFFSRGGGRESRFFLRRRLPSPLLFSSLVFRCFLSAEQSRSFRRVPSNAREKKHKSHRSKITGFKRKTSDAGGLRAGRGSPYGAGAGRRHFRRSLQRPESQPLA